MSSSSDRRLRHRDPEAGFSLLEIMVVVALLGIVLPIGYSLLFSVQKTETNTTNAFAASSQAQLMVDVLTKQLEAAAPPTTGSSPFVSASANALTFYSDLGSTADPSAPAGNAPTQIAVTTQACTRCSLPMTSLVETITPPSSSGSYTGASSTFVVATGILVPTGVGNDCQGTPGIFQYYLDSPATTCVAPTAAPTSQVQAVKLNLTAVAPNNGSSADPAPPTTITSVVPLRNVEYAVANP